MQAQNIAYELAVSFKEKAQWIETHESFDVAMVFTSHAALRRLLSYYSKGQRHSYSINLSLSRSDSLEIFRQHSVLLTIFKFS